MRICYVSRECSPYTGGGIGTYTRNVLAAMARAGHEVVLVSDFLGNPQPEQIKAELELAGIPVVVPEPLPDDLVNCYYHPYHEYADRVYRTLRRYCMEHPVDVIEFPEYRAEGFTCIRAKRLLGEFERTTLVVKCHTPTSLLLQINNQQTRDEQVYHAIYMEDYCVMHADCVTSPSRSLAAYYRDRLQLQSIAPSPYPLALSEVRDDAAANPERAIVFVGRLEWRKGVDLLINALTPVLRAQPDLVLDCYGGDTLTGPFETSMAKYLERRCIPLDLADRIRLHGAVPYADVIKRLARATVCVFPSRWENWPNVCLEAMSLKVPVVASCHGGMAEMIEDGQSGFVVDPANSEQLAERVCAILTDRKLAQALGQRAALRARQLCDYAACAQAIEQSYSSVKTHPFRRIDESAEQPRVSVIIPFYNQGEWLEEAVRSALDSRYANLEVVVVNDGSTDPASQAAFDRLIDPRVKKICKPNGGLSSARNAGIAAASGSFLLPLDADDLIHPDYIPRAVEALLNNTGLAYVTCYVKNFGAQNDHYVPVGLVRQVMLLINPAGKCSSLFRREALEQIGGYDEYMISFEDWDVLCRLAATSWDGDVLPEAYFFYRRRPESMVYQEALPRQMQLMQYMIAKNRRLYQTYADDLLPIALAMWHREYLQVARAAENLALMTADRDRLWEETQMWCREYHVAAADRDRFWQQLEDLQRSRLFRWAQRLQAMATYRYLRALIWRIGMLLRQVRVTVKEQ